MGLLVNGPRRVGVRRLDEAKHPTRALVEPVPEVVDAVGWRDTYIRARGGRSGSMDGIAAVLARIQEISSQFGITTAGGVLGASDPSTAGSSSTTGTAADTSSFADALAQAQGVPGTGASSTVTDPAVPASSGSPTAPASTRSAGRATS